jgi:uncharacterized protein (TIGR02145 family)
MKKIGLLLFLILFCSSSYSQNICPGIPTVTYSGKTYNTVQIGTQCWLKENLDIGTMINSINGGTNGDGNQTNNGVIEKYCYNDVLANCTTYGGLYQWAEMVQYQNGATNTTLTTPPLTGKIQGICPVGWHVPTYTEMQTLATTVGNDGNSLKAVGQGTGTNTSGFSALLGGGKGSVFSSKGLYTLGWSSTEINAGTSYDWQLDGSDNKIYFLNPPKRYAVSVRCLNDNYPLPVELGLLTAVDNGRTVQLNWETKTEKNSDKFNIERKTVGADWGLIGSVKAAVLSNSPKQYSYTDKNLLSGQYQYRLKMIDNDGTFNYSSIVEAEVAVPKNYELSQNFPNPFNPNTVISYSLPLASNVRLIVYNSLGQTVKVLENGFKNAGTYSVNFNASELPTGTYFYKMEAGQFSQIKKMMLLK